MEILTGPPNRGFLGYCLRKVDVVCIAVRTEKLPFADVVMIVNNTAILVQCEYVSEPVTAETMWLFKTGEAVSRMPQPGLCVRQVPLFISETHTTCSSPLSQSEPSACCRLVPETTMCFSCSTSRQGFTPASPLSSTTGCNCFSSSKRPTGSAAMATLTLLAASSLQSVSRQHFASLCRCSCHPKSNSFGGTEAVNRAVQRHSAAPRIV